MTPIPPTALNRYRVRFLSQLLTEATADYWERRAETLAASRPRPGDFTGRATASALAAADDRCRRAAEACRFHAWLIRTEGSPDAAREALAALSEADLAEAALARPVLTQAALAEATTRPTRPGPDAHHAALLALSDVELAAALAARRARAARTA